MAKRCSPNFRNLSASDSLKVLFVAPEDPYCRDGGANLRLRPFIEAVTEVGESHLLTLVPDSSQMDMTGRYASLETVTNKPTHRITRLIRSLANLEPDIATRSRTTRLATALHRILLREKFDVVHLAGLQLAYLIPAFRGTFGTLTKTSGRPSLVLDELNAEYVVHRRMAAATTHGYRKLLGRIYSQCQMALLKRYEKRLLPLCDAVLCPGQNDLDSLHVLSPEATLRVVHSGVDIAALESVPSPSQDPVIIFIGDLDYRPNREAVEWLIHGIAPEVQARVPGVRFLVVGKGGRSFVHRSAAFEFTGYVEDVRPYLGNSRLVVVPLLSGGGIKLKVLEAMAAGRPIVTTPVGAEGIGELGGNTISIACSTSSFVEAITRIIQDDDLVFQMGYEARNFVKKGFSARASGARYLETVKSIQSGGDGV